MADTVAPVIRGFGGTAVREVASAESARQPSADREGIDDGRRGRSFKIAFSWRRPGTGRMPLQLLRPQCATGDAEQQFSRMDPTPRRAGIAARELTLTGKRCAVGLTTRSPAPEGIGPSASQTGPSTNTWPVW